MVIIHYSGADEDSLLVIFLILRGFVFQIDKSNGIYIRLLWRVLMVVIILVNFDSNGKIPYVC